VILALDVHYRSVGAVVGAVRFREWSDATPIEAASIRIDREIADYEPGSFFRRELPCLLTALERFPLEPGDVVIVDGLVDLAPGRPGLGRHLFERLPPGVAVVGVAKTSFHESSAVRVRRGESARPLHVNAVGMPDEQAAQHIAAMHGPFRVPTLLKLADQLSRA
jgi:deoxyribonuclease V